MGSLQVPLPLRIAAWSGPRNISTAMLRAWENRGDCAVSDEPLYAHYLASSGRAHPGRADIIAAGDVDWRRVVAGLTGPVPGGRPLWYQKHMAHHLLPTIDTGWVHSLRNVFLIRDPALVVASYLKSQATVAPADLGVAQQIRLFDEVSERLGSVPPVIDAERFLADPAGHLRRLCERLGIDFVGDRMLHWPAGRRASDGIWGPHWYGAVWRSTGFEPARGGSAPLHGEAERVADACRPAYEMLLRHA